MTNPVIPAIKKHQITVIDDCTREATLAEAPGGVFPAIPVVFCVLGDVLCVMGELLVDPPVELLVLAVRLGAICGIAVEAPGKLERMLAVTALVPVDSTKWAELLAVFSRSGPRVNTVVV
jgi:hypothetical protein